MSGGAAFVTGGTGFIGGAVLRRLLADGRDVVALSRSDDDATRLANLGARAKSGDVLDDPDALAAGMQGCEVLFHMAGVNSLCLHDPAPLYRTNVLGSHNIVTAAYRAGVNRIVYTSSAAVVGEGNGETGVETSAHRGYFLSHYERSKYEAERAVLATAASAGIEVVCVNPSSVQGPGRIHGTARLLLDYANGKLKVALDTIMSVVDIADCVEGHVLAEGKGAAGARYILNGASLPVSRAIEMMSGLTGIEHRVRMIPPPAARALAITMEVGGLLRRRRPSMCREMMATLIHGHRYDGSKATRELGLVYTPLEDTILRTMRWYSDEGLISRPTTL